MRSLTSRSKPIPTLYVKSLGKSCDQDDIRSIFEKARETTPYLLVFEDIDSLISNDVKSFFLNEIDGLEGNDGIMIIGSTNYYICARRCASNWLARLTCIPPVDRLDAGISKRPSRFDRKYHFALPATPERIQYCDYWRFVSGNRDHRCLHCLYTLDQSCRRIRRSDCLLNYPLHLPISPRVSVSRIFKKPSSPLCYRSFGPKGSIRSYPWLQKFLPRITSARMTSARMRCGKRLASRSKHYAKKWKIVEKVWRMPRGIVYWVMLVQVLPPRQDLDFPRRRLVVDALFIVRMHSPPALIPIYLTPVESVLYSCKCDRPV